MRLLPKAQPLGVRPGGAGCRAGIGRVQTLWDSGPLEGWGPTESGQGEEASCCFWSAPLLLSGYWSGCLEETGKRTMCLSPDTSPAPLEPKFSFLSDGQLRWVLCIGTESWQGRCGERRSQGRVQYYLLVSSQGNSCCLGP